MLPFKKIVAINNCEVVTYNGYNYDRYMQGIVFYNLIIHLKEIGDFESMWELVFEDNFTEEFAVYNDTL